MADQKQVKLLLEGVAGWNKWRSENPSTSIDLSGADLRSANLSRATVTDAIFTDATGANLSGSIGVPAYAPPTTP